ncbi:MAG: PEP-CTERM sorting domain-containing protein [Pirellulales bacterium]
MIRSFLVTLAMLLVATSSTRLLAVPMEIRLIGITGKQSTGESGVSPDDDKLFEINLTNAAVTPLIKLPFVPDSTAIGFNPENGLLYRTAGSEAYRNQPNRIAFNDNQFMQTVDVYTPGFPQVGIFNSNAPGDTGFGPYGLPAPRPNFVLPAERRTDDQTDPMFRQNGPNEYHALRDLTWSSSEHLFYGADERGIYRLTPEGESTFVGHPGGLEPKGITFFNINGQRRLLLSERDGPTLSTIDPMTGLIVGDPVVLVDELLSALTGVLSLVEHPDGTTLYGITKKPDHRELIRIDPVTGNTTMVGILDPPGDAEFADLAFVFKEAPVIHTWNVDVNGNWSLAANWTNGEPNGVGVAASFLGAITAPRTITIDGPRTVGSLTFNNANSYTLAGTGPLTIDSDQAATIDVLAGSHTISAPISFPAGQTVNKTGPGTLTLSGVQTHGAGAVLAANGGVTNLNSDGGANLSVQANARVNFGATQHLAGLQIGAGATAQLTAGASKNLATPSLTIAGTPAAPTGTLDVTNNALVLDYVAGSSPTMDVRQRIIAGRGKTGLGATWNGPGITSSTAAADAATNPEATSVGYAANIELPLGPYAEFRGQPVDDTAVLVRYTRTGDANLDGVVNDDDVTIIGATYAPGVPQPSWALGDFDYNGFVDDDDVTLLGVFYDPTAMPVLAPVEAVAGGVAAVPEPSTMVLLGVMAVGILMRRRFRRGLSR